MISGVPLNTVNDSRKKIGRAIQTETERTLCVILKG